MMVASIFFLVMVNYLECFCKEQYILVASIFSLDGLSFGMILLKFYYFGWFCRRFIIWDGFVEVLVFGLVL